MFYKAKDLQLTNSLREHYPISYRKDCRAPIWIRVSDSDIHIIAHVKFDKRFLEPYKNLVKEGQKDTSDPFLKDKPDDFTFADAFVEGVTKNWSGVYSFPWFYNGTNNKVRVKVSIVRKDLLTPDDPDFDPEQRYLRVKFAPFFAPSSFVASYPWRWIWGLPLNLSLESVALNWSPYSPGIINLKHYYSLGRFEQVCAHEFGHALGIGDCYDAPYRFFYQMPNVTGYMMCYNHKVQNIELEMVLNAHLKKRMQFFPIKFSFKTFFKGLIQMFKD